MTVLLWYQDIPWRLQWHQRMPMLTEGVPKVSAAAAAGSGCYTTITRCHGFAGW